MALNENTVCLGCAHVKNLTHFFFFFSHSSHLSILIFNANCDDSNRKKKNIFFNSHIFYPSNRTIFSNALNLEFLRENEKTQKLKIHKFPFNYLLILLFSTKFCGLIQFALLLLLWSVFFYFLSTFVFRYLFTKVNICISCSKTPPTYS